MKSGIVTTAAAAEAITQTRASHLRPYVGKLLVLDGVGRGQMRQLVILVNKTDRRAALALSVAGLLALFVAGAAARYVEHGRRGGGQRVLVVRLPPAARLGGLLLGHAAATAPGTTTIWLRIGHAVVAAAVAMVIVSPAVLLVVVY